MGKLKYEIIINTDALDRGIEEFKSQIKYLSPIIKFKRSISIKIRFIIGTSICILIIIALINLFAICMGDTFSLANYPLLFLATWLVLVICYYLGRFLNWIID